MHDVIVVGGGFAGVTAARELAFAGLDVLLVEARDRLGGRTWRTAWNGLEVELGGGYVHWHQPHAFAELTRAGLGVRHILDAELVAWRVGETLHRGTMADRHVVALRGWNAFTAGAAEALPLPYSPLAAADAMRAADAQTAAERIAALGLDDETRAVLEAEVESVTSAPLNEAGAFATLRWHALSGYSLELTQAAGGAFTFATGTRPLLEAMAAQAQFARRLGAPVAGITRGPREVVVALRDGEQLTARGCILALPLNCLGDLAFEPAVPSGLRAAIACGQASRGSKIFIHVRGERRTVNAIVPGHSLGYVSSDRVLDDGSQLLVTFGADSTLLDVTDLAAVQTALDRAHPGYEVLAARMHDWTADEFAKGTWGVHRPGWYSRHHETMQRPEGRMVFAGSDIANGWAGFIDGAIESGLTGARRVRAVL